MLDEVVACAAGFPYSSPMMEKKLRGWCDVCMCMCTCTHVCVRMYNIYVKKELNGKNVCILWLKPVRFTSGE